MANQKYTQTARLGEGVIYTGVKVRGDRRHHAALIVKQHTETLVDLLVLYADGKQERLTSIEYDSRAEKANTWAARPR